MTIEQKEASCQQSKEEYGRRISHILLFKSWRRGEKRRVGNRRTNQEAGIMEILPDISLQVLTSLEGCSQVLLTIE
jgi:hypothetical protein